MTLLEIIYLIIQCAALASWFALPLGLIFIKSKKIKRAFLGSVLFINVLLAGFMVQQQRAIPEISTTESLGDFWDIETVLQAEPDISSRAWKRNILEELSTNLNNYRVTQNFEPVELDIIESFSPLQLDTLLKNREEDTQLLDVREAYEFAGFGLPGAQSFRYGDLANNQIPKLNKDNRIVVLCYSGIRGYLVANLLKQQGFEKVSFVRGGLEAWHEAGLEGRGDINNFTFLSGTYDRVSYDNLLASGAKKIDFTISRRTQNLGKIISNAVIFNGELQTTTTVQNFMSSLENKPLILLCETESECYDARMFAYLYEQRGGSINGYYEF
jgi:rhodanese-related sulfurtransferase